MGSKIIYLFILLPICFLSCGCPEEPDIVSLLTKEQNVWLSEVPADTSVIYVKSSNGLSDIFIMSVERSKRRDKTGNTCSAQELTEAKRVNYFSNLAGYYFYFYIARDNKSYGLSTEVNLGGNVSSFTSRFSVDLDYPNNLKNTFFYPYTPNINNGYMFYGDSTINGISYNDLYFVKLNFKEKVKPLTVRKFFISKTRGLVSFQTENGVHWTLDI